MNSPIPLLTPKPGHVPDVLVVDYDYVSPAGMEEVGVYNAVKCLHDGPDIIWSQRHGGLWMVTSAEDICFVLANYEIFSPEELMIPRTLIPLITPPIAVDATVKQPTRGG